MADRNSFSLLSGLDPNSLREFPPLPSSSATMAIGPSHGPPKSDLPFSYRQSLLQPADYSETTRQKVTSHWKPKNAALMSTITRGALVRTTIEKLRASSSPSSPVCFKCADKGHTAVECRNLALCFLCNKFGHRSTSCRSVTTNPPSPRRAPVRASSFLLPSSSQPPLLPLPSVHTLQTKPMTSASMKAPIRTLYCTEASDLEEQAFQRSFFLTDTQGWGAFKIETALSKLVKHFQWVASRFDEHRYLIEAPSPQWLNATLSRGHVLLDNVHFKISP
ncbi:Gag polyprotein [Carex littledalei]|uniref:Gag polyprotein n=1 Tax=Carex littledalei TaxID=544730 RepID=A0A833VGM7_9POAL|nr:Gag polyprotein [Carex littledalei]